VSVCLSVCLSVSVCLDSCGKVGNWQSDCPTGCACQCERPTLHPAGFAFPSVLSPFLSSFPAPSPPLYNDNVISSVHLVHGLFVCFSGCWWLVFEQRCDRGSSRAGKESREGECAWLFIQLILPASLPHPLLSLSVSLHPPAIRPRPLPFFLLIPGSWLALFFWTASWLAGYLSVCPSGCPLSLRSDT